MAQNIYDNPDFFNGYSQLPRQVHGLDGAPEWPMIRCLLPPLQGSRVVDLGCGFGWASRWMREQGAASVLAVDLSERMLERARADTADSGIDYQRADLETFELPAGRFDLVYSALTLHYLRDLPRLVRNVQQALVPGGYFVFTQEHPIFMAASHPGWMRDADGRPTWPVNRYADESERRTDWFAPGVIKHHRTLASILNALFDAGLQVRRLEEFAPTVAQVEDNPALAEERERPMMMMVAAQRPLA